MSIKNRSKTALGAIFAVALIFGPPWGATNAEASIFLLAVALLAVLLSFRQSFNRSVVAFLLFVVIVNGFAFLLGDEYSTWQFIRSGIPFLTAPAALLAGIEVGRTSRNDTLHLGFQLLTIAAMLNAVLYFLGASLFNALIAVEGRIYAVPSLAFLPLLYYFAVKRQWVFAMACFALLAATGSKVILLASASVLLLASLRVFRLSFRSIGNVAVLVLVISLGIGVYNERFIELLAVGDENRVRQVADAWNAISDGVWGALFGHSFGIPSMPGYWDVGQISEDNERLFENSRYDLDNGFLFILLKIGFLGSAIMMWMYWRLPVDKPSRNLILVTVFANLFSSAAIVTSADGAFCHLILGIVAIKAAKIETTNKISTRPANGFKFNTNLINSKRPTTHANVIIK